MNILKFILQLLGVLVVSFFLGAIVQFSKAHGLETYFFIIMFFIFYTSVNWTYVKESQRANDGTIYLLNWEKMILFPMKKNLFRKENVRFQRTLLSSTVGLLILMTIVQLSFIKGLALVYIAVHGFQLKKLDRFFRN